MTTTEAPGGLELFQGGGGLSFRYTPEEVQRYSQELLALTQSLLIENTDYGLIPGTKRPTLYKPGAEKLAMIAGFAIHEDPRETREGITYRYTALRVQPGTRWVCGLCGEQIGGIPVGQAEGYAGYDEDRCLPSAGAKRAKAEADERYWAEKDNRAVRPSKWEAVPAEEYRAPWNSVINTSQKRGFVAAILNAVAGSGLFTQDLEDGQGEPPGAPYVPMDHLGTWLTLLSQEERGKLREWREAKQLPVPSEMEQAEVERVLVFIGTLMGVRGPAAPAEGTAAEPQPTVEPLSSPGPPSNAAAPAEAPQVATEGLGATEGQDPDEIPDLDNPGPAPDAVPTAGDRAVAAFDAAIGYTPPAAELQPGRAAHFHRKAGAMKYGTKEQDAIIMVASDGRTRHASELDVSEMAFAELLLVQLGDGSQKIEDMLAAAEEMQPGRKAS